MLLSAHMHILWCDYFMLAGKLENVFSLLLNEEGEDRHRLLTKHYNSDYCWNTELFNT